MILSGSSCILIPKAGNSMLAMVEKDDCWSKSLVVAAGCSSLQGPFRGDKVFP